MPIVDFDSGTDSATGSTGGVERRRRQRRRRAQLTTEPQKSFPWLTALHLSIAALLVAVMAVVLDWLQPLELLFVSVSTLLSALVSLLIVRQTETRKVGRYVSHLLGPITCAMAISLSAGLLALLQQVPATRAYTDRNVIAVESELRTLVDSGEIELAEALLAEAIDSTDSSFWRERWEKRKAEIHRRQEPLQPLPPAEDEFDESEDPEEPTKDLPTGQVENETPEPLHNRHESTTKSSQAEPVTVLNRVIEFQASGNYSDAESYLRRLIQTEPRSDWQCDYEQLYVDHWVDWGQGYKDLDHRHVCYLKALQTARRFRRDTSVLSDLLVELERELSTLPTRLPAGCQLFVHSAEMCAQELRIELSVLSPTGEFLPGLVANDFRIRCGETDVPGIRLTTGSPLTQPTKRNVAVVVDLSCSDAVIAEARLAAATQVLLELPADTSKLLVMLGDKIEMTAWTSDGVETIQRKPPPTHQTYEPPLRQAIANALEKLADRTGAKDLVIFSRGRELAKPYLTTTSLVQHAAKEDVCIHAIVDEPAKGSVHQLLSDLSQGTGGHFRSIVPTSRKEAWEAVTGYFPKGNLLLHVPLDHLSGGDLRITVGRGATLLYAVLDTPGELRL